jgi:Ni/Fe-hydrogenase 1 B-type cytochrome subunit
MAVERRSVRRAHEAGTRPARHTVYVWELPVRIVDWTIVITLVVLSITGIYIYSPFPIAASTTVGDPGFTMASVRFIHENLRLCVHRRGAGPRVLGVFGQPLRALASAAADHPPSMAGSARHDQLLHPPTPASAARERHNPLAALAYLGVYGLFGLSIISGFGLFAWVGRIPAWQTLFGWTYRLLPIEQLRLLHVLLMFVFGAFTAFHVYCSILIDVDERNGELSSIITGYKANMLEGGTPRDAPQHSSP